MKINIMLKNMKRFFQMIQKDHPSILLYVIGGGIAAGVLPFISLFFSTKILDALLAADVELAKRQVLILLAVSLVVGIIDRVCMHVLEVLSAAGGHSVRKQTTHKAFTMEYEQYEKTETMDNIRRAKSAEGNWGIDVQIGQSYYIISCTVSVICAVALSIDMIMKSCTKPIFILYTILLLVAFIALMKGITIRQDKNEEKNIAMTKKNERYSSSGNYVMSSALDVQNGKDIRLYKMQKMILSWYQSLMKKSNRFFGNAVTYTAFSNGCIAVMCQLFAGLTFIYTGLGVLHGVISIGSVVLYTRTIDTMVDRINEFIGIYSVLAYRFEYLREFDEFIHSEKQNPGGTLPVNIKPDSKIEFEFRNVSFRYPGTEVDVLKNVNLKLDFRKRLAVVGKNGAGKTTLIKLLCRLYQPTEGEIRLNGVNIQEYEFEQYTNLFSVVFQDFKLFSLPLDENIASGSIVDKERCERVLRDVDMEDTVMFWKEKEHTLLYKNLGDGVNVSGGEAQKIAIARALYKDAPFVIMDEPTAALDPIAEAEIYDNFNKLIKNKTAVFISHRMSSCKFCDEIVVFEEGKITQKGTHQKLLQEDGLYKELWNAQAQYYS